MDIYIYIFVWVYVALYVCKYIYIHMYMYIYNMYVYIYPYWNKPRSTVNFIYIYFLNKTKLFIWFGFVCQLSVYWDEVICLSKSQKEGDEKKAENNKAEERKNL